VERQVEAPGPTGARVAQRVRELRQERGLTLADLAAELERFGRPILLTALSKLEKGQRRINVDDLVALALALDVSPNVLLLPKSAKANTDVALTETHRTDSLSAWKWATRDVPAESGDGAERSFFISYSYADRSWAEWIAWQLEEAGEKTFLSQWDLLPGSDWESKIQRELREASFVVAVVSRDYLQSPHAQRELKAVRDRYIHGSDTKLLPIRIDAEPVPDELRSLQYVSLSEISEPQARQRLLDALRSMQIGRAKPQTAPVFPVST
jgi:transcriptional regulator with XRE-family HTH domain